MIERNINVSKYKPLGGSSCIKLSKELDCSKQGVINIQNKGNNKCLKRRLVRFLHPVRSHQNWKNSKDFATKLDFKDIKFPVRIRDIHKVVKKMHQHCCFRFSK